MIKSHCLLEEQSSLSFTGQGFITEYGNRICSMVWLGNAASGHHLLYKLQPQLFCEPLTVPSFSFMAVPSVVCSALITLLKDMQRVLLKRRPSGIQRNPIAYNYFFKEYNIELPKFQSEKLDSLDWSSTHSPPCISMRFLQQRLLHQPLVSSSELLNYSLMQIQILITLFYNKVERRKINAIYVFKAHSSSIGLSEFE